MVLLQYYIERLLTQTLTLIHYTMDIYLNNTQSMHCLVDSVVSVIVHMVFDISLSQ